MIEYTYTNEMGIKKKKEDKVQLKKNWQGYYLVWNNRFLFLTININCSFIIMIEYTYTNEMGIKKKKEDTVQLKKNWQGYYLVWK